MLLDLPLGLRLNKSIASWKRHMSKTHLIHQTYWTGYVTLAYPTVFAVGNYLEFSPKGNCLPLLLFTRSRKQRWEFCRHNGMWQHKTQYPKMLTTRYDVEYELCFLMAVQLTGSYRRCHCPASWESLLPRISSPGRDQNSKEKSEMMSWPFL